MKKYIFLAFATLCTTAWASRAQHGVLTLRQPDGTMIEVRLHGDEHYNYYTTPQGEPLLRTAEGMLVPSTWEEVHQQAWEETLMTDNKQPGAQHVIDLYANTDKRFFPHQGQPRVCVIMLEFPDKPFTYSKSEIDEWLNGTQTQFESAYKSYSSVAEYFDFCSQGQFRPIFDVYGPYKASQESPAYGYDKGSSTSARSVVTDALIAADAEINFAQYDNYYEDDCIDLVYVIFSGEGANTSGDKSQPWSMAGSMSNLGTYDGVTAWRYGISNEIIVGGGNTYQTGIGVFCHELSHTMGLPDLYETIGKMPDWDNNGPEAWDLMDDGENLVNGFWPMPYVAWEREAFGWIELDELTKPQDVTLYPLNDPEGRGRACRVTNPANPDEYYTLEVIPETKQYGWITRYKAQGGMLLTHVNYSEVIFGTMRPNNVYGHPYLTIVPADGLLLSSASIGEDRMIDGQMVTVDRSIYRSNLGGDPYPGNKEVHAVAAYHNYTDGINDDNPTDMVETLPITDIEQHEDGAVSFKFRGGNDQAISTIKSDRDTNRGIYSLNGQYLGKDFSALVPGIYITEGKKIILNRVGGKR